MLIGEVLEELSKVGMSLEKVAKTLGIGKEKLKATLNKIGYEHSRGRGWYFIGKGEPPLQSPISAYIPTKPAGITKSNKKVITSNEPTVKGNNQVITSNKSVEKGSNPVITSNNFTAEEVQTLKELASKFITNGNNEVIKNRVNEIEKADRIRKTFHISNSLVHQLNKLADQNNIKQSDLLEIALLDLINRYK